MQSDAGTPWQRLNFLPEPHGHGSLRVNSRSDIGASVIRAASSLRMQPLPLRGAEKAL